MNIILLKENETFLPKGDKRYEHIQRILNLKVGDTFRSGIINGEEGTSRILSSSSEGLEIDFNGNGIIKPLYPVTLLLAMIRPICMKRILRDSQSLGIKKIVLTVSELGEKSYLESSFYKENTYKDVILDGLMQSGSTMLSECVIIPSLKDAIKEVSNSEKILLDNKIGKLSISKAKFDRSEVTLSIGPERGWTDNERDIFMNSGFKAYSLGERILRTETAACTSLSITLERMGFV